MPRQLAIGKRVSLAEIYPGWTDEAYAIVQPASYADKIVISNYAADGKTNAEGLEYELATVKKHFVKGKIFVLGEDGNNKLDDLQASDLDNMVDVTQRLFIAMMGVDADPKDTSTPTATLETPLDSSAPQPLENSTKTE